MITFLLNTQSGVPYYRQIVDQIRFGIATGELGLGEQLPTVRALSVQLKINLNTVSKAYKELEIQNILKTQQGTGTFVATSSINLPESERQDKLQALTTEFLNNAAAYGFTVEELMKQLKQTKELPHD